MGVAAYTPAVAENERRIEATVFEFGGIRNYTRSSDARWAVNFFYWYEKIKMKNLIGGIR